MNFFPVYCISLASLCLGCSEIADIMFVMDGSDSVSSVDFLHEVTFVASQPTQYTVSSSHVRFGAILYGSHVTSQINIVPNTENNLFVNKVTQLKRAGGQPLLFRALTELRKELSTSDRGGSKQIAVVILSDKLRNRHAVLREVGYLRRAGVRVLPVGIGSGIQDSDLRDLLTFANPTYKFNSFSDIYQLSKDIYNSVCQKSHMYETTSLPQPETFTRLRDGIVTVHSYKDGKQRYLVPGDKPLLRNERGLQIEVPVLREMVEKQPSVRPFFISYSLLDTKGSREKNNHDVSTSKPKTTKTVSGIIIDNEIWLQTSTPMIKTFSKDKPWATNTIERPVEDNTSMQWMAKGAQDFKEILTKLGRKGPNHTSKTSKSYTKWSTSNKVTDTEVERSEKRKPTKQKTGQKDKVIPMQGYAILHNENRRDDSYRKNQTKANAGNITKVNRRTEDERLRDSVNSRVNRKQSKTKSSSTSHVKKENNVIYTTETPSTTKDNGKKSPQNENGIPVRNSLRQNALAKAMSGNSILQDNEKTAITWMKAETEQSLQKSSGDRSVLTNNMSSDRHVRPIFTLSGAIDNNVFSGGNSLHISSNLLSQNGLSPNRIVHERPQITSNLFSPSNEFYIENGVNSISYKEHFQKLLNPDSKSSESVKTPYSFDGSKLYSSGSLYAPHKNSFQSPMTIYPTTPVTTHSRSNHRPFYLNEDKYDQLIPSITESSTQPSMFDTERITTRNSQTFPPNFLAILGISLENDSAPRARNFKSSSLVQALSPANAEGYYHPETNVHFYRPAPYLPTPWDEETTGYSRNLPLRPYRQNQRQMGFNIRGNLGLS